MARAALNPDTKVTDQQERFAMEYVRSGKRSIAYRRAYNVEKMSPDAVRIEANRLIGNPSIALRIEHYRTIALRRLEVSVERIALEMSRIAFFDPRDLFDDTGNPVPISDLDEDVARVISGLDVEDLFERDPEGKRVKVGNVLKYKISDKLRALEMLAKWKKMLIERSETGKPGEFGDKTTEELEAEARETLDLAVKQGLVKILPTSSQPKDKRKRA